jgi:RimJ/RimL family protein N-acetyltransferase
VIALINFNDMDDERNLDIGHIINTRYIAQDYEYEALKALYNFAFIRLGSARVEANWALQDKEKIAPLLKLGMRIVGTKPIAALEGEGAYRAGPTAAFESARLMISREEWLTNPAK